MKNNDEILKYLSDLMNETEKENFEKDLASSDELKRELARYQDLLGGLNVPDDIAVDSHYFQNLLPRVRTRLEKQKRRRWIPQFAYIIPTAAAVFLIMMNTGKLNNDTKIEQKINKPVVEVSADKIEIDELLNGRHPAEQVGAVDLRKSQQISFEVGISGVANSETLKTVADKDFNISFMDDYLLASK